MHDAVRRVDPGARRSARARPPAAGQLPATVRRRSPAAAGSTRPAVSALPPMTVPGSRLTSPRILGPPSSSISRAQPLRRRPQLASGREIVARSRSDLLARRAVVDPSAPTVGASHSGSSQPSLSRSSRIGSPSSCAMPRRRRSTSRRRASSVSSWWPKPNRVEVAGVVEEPVEVVVEQQPGLRTEKHRQRSWTCGDDRRRRQVADLRDRARVDSRRRTPASQDHAAGRASRCGRSDSATSSRVCARGDLVSTRSRIAASSR